LKKIVNSPLKILGLLTAVFGLLGMLTFSYLFYVGIYLLGIGVLIYFIDYITLRLLRNKNKYWITQSILTTTYLILAFMTYMKWQEHNYIIFSKEFKGQAGIIFGIEGYPELPETKLWKKTINMPENGIIITSTKVEDIPSTIRFAYTDNSKVGYQNIDWDPNFEMDCIVCDSKIKGWLFQVDKESSKAKEVMTSLCNEIATNQKNSYYKSENSVVSSDNKGKYLMLQNKGLSSLPGGLGKLNIYKAILTGNNFKEIPEQIFEINRLEDLILAVNPIDKFPCNLSRLKKLKTISVAETGIKEINCNLSNLDSLEDFDISRNGLTKFPEQIKTIPNLTWLSLNNNKFTDFSFIDDRLSNLETLYLYSNKIKVISGETKFLIGLKELLIFDNEIVRIPDNISDLKSLERLEIWNNPVKSISPKIAALAKLKSMRLDDDFLTQTDKDNLKKWLPNCEITYQTRSEKKNGL
jgi:cell fate (sporulation/competence/biofilm development) regulator YmcA (YheA/YmcA/DUF963 family)